MTCVILERLWNLRQRKAVLFESFPQTQREETAEAREAYVEGRKLGNCYVGEFL